MIAEQNSFGITRYIRSSELTARNTDAARTYYHYVSDEMGSVTHVVDADGIVLNRYEYDAWGNTNLCVLNRYEYDAWGNTNLCEEKVPSRFKFTGQQLDPVTHQYYLRARFYNPVIARFTQEDTYRGDGLNLYTYCQNNLVFYADPSGYAAKAICDAKADAYRQKQANGEQLAKQEWEELKRYERAHNDPNYKLERDEGITPTDAYHRLHPNQPVKPSAQTPEATSATRPLTWNEFQRANQGKYSRHQMSEAWSNYKKTHYPNEGKHYLHRPYIRKEIIDILNSQNPNKLVADINNVLYPCPNAHIGHTFGNEFWRLRNLAESRGMTQAEFNDFMNQHPGFYQYEDPLKNSSHMDEDKSSLDFNRILN